MIKEAYVSYEVAKLLKEKGFAEPLVNYYYTTKGERVSYLMPEEQYLCPTHQMACAWLREMHNIDIEIRRSPNTMMYRCIVYKDTLVKCITDAIMETYEQAVEAALKYSLENLI